MPPQIALLRAVNVGGIKVSMVDLKTLLADLGFEDVRTLLNSGNAVFRSKGATGEDLEKALETEFAKRAGRQTEFFVRTAEEWKSIIDRNPMTDEARRDPGHLLVVVLKRALSNQEVESLRAAIVGPEVVEGDGKQAYIYYPAGVGQSKLTPKLIEKHLGSPGTGRNWNTVLKLGAMVS
ncbi:MAG TPA: DUF1697 domain-containing protein [Chthoniobacterales bacterium]|jgi:uncharacterized protein (DUF1697 family)|nr:DUF1697 domain-containing protein [Chthoniobacterales bacterium]